VTTHPDRGKTVPQPSAAPRPPELPHLAECGSLGVAGLKRLWARRKLAREGFQLDRNDAPYRERLVIDALGLGLEQTMHYLSRAPSFDEFERWIEEITGGIDPARAARLNALLTGGGYDAETRRWLESIDAAEPVLDDAHLRSWERDGFVVVRGIVPHEACRGAELAVWDHLEMDPADPETWYRKRDHGIMVQFYQHPALETIRRSPRIHKAFAQLFGTADLWMTTDRVSFNVPERPGFPFQGPDLHWDTSLKPPVPLGVQGLLYLTDTPPEQGAFTLVPGFHRRLESWLAGLPPGANPRKQDLHALGSRPIGAGAGDLILWHHALPHGASANRGVRPRIVQYLRMYTAEPDFREWI
jgi:hypothetical protein